MLAEPLLKTTIQDILQYIPGYPTILPSYLFCDGERIGSEKPHPSQKNVLGMAYHQPSKESFELRIADHHRIDEPIYILHLSDEKPQSFIHIGRQSQVLIVEMFISSAKTHFTLDPEAQLKHCILQWPSHNVAPAALSTQIHIHQKKASVYQANSLLMGGPFNQSALHLHLEEAYTESKIYGIQQAKGSDKVEQTIEINHQSPHSQSQVKIRGVAFDQSTLSFQGMIRVKKEAFKTDASLENKNLLLSDKAQINTQPELAIENADVRCTHGATVGHLEPEALFYLQSRGISKKNAQDLLIHAFSDPMLTGLSKPLSTLIRDLLDGS